MIHPQRLFDLRSRGLPERQPTHPVGLVLNLDRIRDQRAAVKFCSAGWGGHRDADKFWQVPRSRGICAAALWCVNAVNQQHRGGETGTGGREGGRTRRNWQKRGGGGGGTKGSTVIQSVTQTTSSADTQYWACPSLRLKGHCLHFTSLSPELSEGGRQV